MLLSLPAEMIQAISHELKSIKDVKSFRLTCKQTDEALAIEMLPRITVNITTRTSGKELSKLQYLASAAQGSSPRPAIQGIRQVHIRSLSFNWHMKGVEFSDEEDDTPVDRTLLEKLCYEMELKQCLYNALSSLTTVKTVRWMPSSTDSKWAHTAVMDALKTLPNLQSLSIKQGYRINIPLHSFTSLQHISVQCFNEGKTFENLIQMISQSPLLESIAFANIHPNGRENDWFRLKNLHQLFKHYPKDRDLLPLLSQHFQRKICLVRLDGKTDMRLFGSLAPSSLYDDFMSEDISETLDRQWGSSHEQIWRKICDAKSNPALRFICHGMPRCINDLVLSSP